MDVIMPQLGETVAEGTVTRWYKKVGDTVKTDEMLFDIETDKVSSEIPSPVGGVLAEIVVPEGETAKVGARLAVIREAGEGAGTTAAGAEKEAAAARGERPSVSRRARASAREKLSPVVRRLCAQHDIDHREVSGTGRDGRVTREDVMNHLSRRGAAVPELVPYPAARAPSKEAGGTLPLNSVRKRVAENMARSWTSVPHVLQVVEADFHRVEEARRELGAAWKQREGFTLSYLPFVARAVSIALAQYARLNATFNGDSLTLRPHINLGIAVDLNFEGLVVPVLKDAPGKSLPQLAREMNDLATRARAGRLRPDELAEGTYTITNNGAFGSVVTAPIINPPQVAVLSTDAVRKKAVVVESEAGDAIAVRPIGVLAQSFDHRAVDGAYAASFLSEVKRIIETRPWGEDLLA